MKVEKYADKKYTAFVSYPRSAVDEEHERRSDFFYAGFEENTKR